MVVLRWVSAVAAGVIAYWVALLLSLGVLAMAVQKVATPADVGHSVTLLSISLLVGSFAGCIAAIMVAPRANWRTMSVVALAVAAAWAVYGQVSAGHDIVAGIIESLAAIAGAAAACALASRLFGASK
ncbi:MAG TPA: hypothetical protein VMU08_06940 [Rhizomicrobium sp.]|nr:hypothetical protein [Rhizomicrobium sp.]